MKVGPGVRGAGSDGRGQPPPAPRTIQAAVLPGPPGGGPGGVQAAAGALADAVFAVTVAKTSCMNRPT
jgi:hypothetical protein